MFTRSILTPIAAAAVLAWLAGCAATSYNLPPVSADTDGRYRPGKFVWHDLISDDVAGSRRFYSELFGWEFRSLSLIGAQYWVISLDGVAIGGMVDQKPLPANRDISQWVSVVSTADVDASRAAIVGAGGSVLRDPVSLGDRGRIAVYADPQGALFASLQTASGDPVDTGELPPVGGFLWHELWTSDPEAAAEFYATLSGLSSRALDDSDINELAVSYYLLRDGEEPRGGVRSTPAPDAPPVWMPYLRVMNLAELESILARVPNLAGEVLIPAVARPGGGHMALIAGPSGAPVALQTWSQGRASPGSEYTQEQSDE